MRLAEGLDPIRVAVVHPADKETVVGAFEAAKSKVIRAGLRRAAGQNRGRCHRGRR